jgi:predicted DsbA family dithiol-disulfide isomerase
VAHDQGAGELRLEEERAKRFGINGVPFSLIDGRVALSDAHEPQIILETIKKAVRRDDT